MTGVVWVLMAIGVLVSLWTLISATLAGGTTSKLQGSSKEHERILRDLGVRKHQFSNYSPWRIRFGILFLVTGIALGAAGMLMENDPLQKGAIAPLILGLIIVLYVMSHQTNTLDLYARGVALTLGKSGTRAAYYPDIANVGYATITYKNNGIEGNPIAKAVVIHLHEGGSFEIGNDFVGFSRITETLADCMKVCESTEKLTGQYRISGSLVNDGTTEEVELEARSPQHARQEALSRYGIMEESCRFVG